MINFRRLSAKSAALLLLSVGLLLASAACIPFLPATTPAPVKPAPPSPGPSQAPAAAQQPAAGPVISENISQPRPKQGVEIIMVHHRGTLTRIGCCNPMLYERDEFVVIQNRGDTPQDINDWSLTNITRGYPTFRFPSHFPCLPYNAPAEDEEEVSGGTYTVVKNPAQSVINTLTPPAETEPPTNKPAGEMDWSSCNPTEPLDQTPMKPAEGQQGIPVRSILYPGQTILVFTDEVHCSSGGFSFNWGQGNIWNNEIPDTAVLYDANGKEVSRRSYTVGR